MAVANLALPNPPIGTELEVSNRRPLQYSMYGFRVDSDFPLPIPESTHKTDETAAWTFRRAEPGSVSPELAGLQTAELRCSHGAVVAVLHSAPDGIWIRHHSLATCHILPGARRVDVYPDPEIDERALGLVLVGQISIVILRQLGYPSLHASAVVTDHGAIAFLGPPGQGKTTMAASFLRHGAALLTDDTLPVQMVNDEVYGSPGLSMMKLWRETAQHTLELADALEPLVADVEKRLLVLDGRFSYADAPARLRALYVLARYDGVAAGTTACTSRTLSGQQALTSLLSQTSYGALSTPVEAARFLPFYAKVLNRVPVRVLAYPNGFEHHEAVRSAIMSDLGQR